MENFDIKSFALGVSSNSGGGYPEPTGTKNITENGIHNVKDYAEANVNVPSGPTPTGTINITQNGTYDVTDKAEAQVNVPDIPADIEALTVNANGTYTATECDGFSPVTVNVPNTYSSTDEGKVVNNGALVAQTSKSVIENGTYDTTLNNSVTVNVPTPTPDLEDITITQNGTYNHPNKDGYDEVTVNVPNTYTSSDEGKVVNNGALASQTSTTKTANGTYDTTLNSEVVVNVPQPSGNINITDMNSTDVSAYATAQVVDADLVASNIKKDVNILGITGTYEGGGTLTKGVAISEPTSENYVYDIYGYGLNGDNPPKKEPPVSMYYHDQYHHAANTQSLTVNLHSNEITHIPANWMQQASSASYPTTVNLPNSITDIGGNAFMYNTGLTSITLPSSLTTIGSFAFGNTGLTSISIPSGVTVIPSQCFYNCTDLQTITIPSGADLKFDYQSLYNTGITSLDFSNATIELGGTAYNQTTAIYGCNSLTQIVGSNIGTFSFNTQRNNPTINSCSSLSTINLQGDSFNFSSQASVAAAINNCPNLTEVHLNFKRYVINLTNSSNGTAFGSSVTKIYLADGKGNASGSTVLGANAFNNTNITDIYVGWSEGEVANAPWGATNATIHYDWTN